MIPQHPAPRSHVRCILWWESLDLDSAAEWFCCFRRWYSSCRQLNSNQFHNTTNHTSCRHNNQTKQPMLMKLINRLHSTITSGANSLVVLLCGHNKSYGELGWDMDIIHDTGQQWYDFKTTYHKNPQLTTTYRQKAPIAQYVRRIDAQIAVRFCAISLIYVMPKGKALGLGDISTVGVSICIGGCVFSFTKAKLVCAVLNEKTHPPIKILTVEISPRALALPFFWAWIWCKSNICMILHRNAQLFVRKFCEHTAQSAPSSCGKLWIFVVSRLEVEPGQQGQQGAIPVRHHKTLHYRSPNMCVYCFCTWSTA